MGGANEEKQEQKEYKLKRWGKRRSNNEKKEELGDEEDHDVGGEGEKGQSGKKRKRINYHKN